MQKVEFFGGKYYTIIGSDVVALGNALQHDLLHTNETVSATFTFYVPKDRYDFIDVVVELPTSSVTQETPAGYLEPAAFYEYRWHPDMHSLEVIIKKVKKDGRTEELATGDGWYFPIDWLRLGLQSTGSHTTLSFWESEPRDGSQKPAHLISR